MSKHLTTKIKPMKINTNQTNLSSVPTNQSTHLKSTLICITQFILLLYLPERTFGQTCNVPVTFR